MTEPQGRERWLYLTLGITLPSVYRDWVERDVQTLGWRIRRAAQLWVGTLLGVALVAGLTKGGSAWGVPVGPSLLGAAIGGFIAGLLQATVMAGYVRRRTLAYYRKKWDRPLAS